MALITRISRLFTADMHAVLDRIEEPDVLLKQHLREMEQELARGEQQLKWLRHEKQSLALRVADIERTIPKIEEELDVCFSSGEDDLARTAIKRRLQAQRLAERLARKHEAAAKTLAEETAQLEENRSRLETLRQQAEILSEDARPEAGASHRPAHEISVSEDEIEIAFLREKQRRTRQ